MLNVRNVGVVAALVCAAACGTEPVDEEPLVVVSFEDSKPKPAPVSNTNGTTEPEPEPEPEPDPNNATTEPDLEPNQGWIGGACSSAAECSYAGASCLTTGHPGGQCSQACDGLCADRDGENSPTFCIDGGSQGRCVSQCDTDLYTYDGCREGYTCQTRTRFGDPTTVAPVCVPDGTPPEVLPEPEPEPEIACLDQLDQLGVAYRAWNYSTQYADGLACTIDDPIYLTGPVNGISYRYFSDSSPGEIAVGCELALALYDLAELLKQYDIVEIEHIGTFNCRKIAGTDYLSIHGIGLAIDFYGFVDSNGVDYVLERDWEHDTTNPNGAKAAMLLEIGQRMFNERYFNIVLTPNYPGHDNHFHVDLTPGGSYYAMYQSPYEVGTGCGN